MITNTSNASFYQLTGDNRAIDDLPATMDAVTANSTILEKIMTGTTTIGTNASIVNTSGARYVQLYACSAGSISTITGANRYVPFTLMMMSSGASLTLLDGTVFVLSANWIPNTIYGNLTLVWDGTRFIEIGRAAT